MKMLDNSANEQEAASDNQENSSDKKNLKISETWYYKAFVKIAYSLINKPLSLLRLIKKVIIHLKKYQSVKDLTDDVKENLFVLLRLIKAYASGSYRKISVSGIVGTIAAIIYFVAPLDFIPDFLLLGFVDDVAIIVWVYDNYRKEIDAFLKWEDEHKIKIELEKF